jgi:KipI family sensor histidine kinase inhibitor
MTPSVPPGEVRRFGDRALLIGAHDAPAARVLGAELRTQLRGADAEVLCGFTTVAVVVRDPVVEPTQVDAAAEQALHAVAARRPEPAAQGEAGHGAGRAVTIPCTFDGPDLDEVADRAGCASEEVAALLTAQPLTVAVVGFSPGFAYLDGLPAALRAVPRRSRPRAIVPAGAVALANGHAAVYPMSSPGGWQLVGRTGYPLFSLSVPPYAALAPGDRVRFRVARADDPTEPAPVALPAWSPPAGARLVCEVVTPGWRAVVQDGGRRGVAASGIPGARPADPVSFALANALTGNRSGAGALEITSGGTRLRGLRTCHVAVVGAAPEVRLDGAPVPAEQVLPFDPGQLLEVGRLRDGCRTYLAIAGGVLGPDLFGSVARDELSGLGAGALVPGARLFVGPWSPPLGDHLAEDAVIIARAGGSPITLRVVPGPHGERFEDGALERLAASVFTAEDDSNRVGVRLRAEGGAPWRGADEAHGELDSQGMVTGAVQVPPGGEPVVLGPDHATLGGYPVVAVVASADHGRLGQCGPGTRVRFVPITPDEADAARRAQSRALERAVVGTSPLPAL